MMINLLTLLSTWHLARILLNKLGYFTPLVIALIYNLNAYVIYYWDEEFDEEFDQGLEGLLTLVLISSVASTIYYKLIKPRFMNKRAAEE